VSIFPATDIVSDVARAADPQRAQAAMKRLVDANSTTRMAGNDFATVAKSATSPPLAYSFESPLNLRGATASIGPSKDPAAAAAQKFEAFVLQSWLEIMLPKQQSGAFGSGGAGGVWRSMMAEQLGAQIASAGGLGLQKIIATPNRNSDSAKA
jgi:flagellar protein FlgJ